MTEHDLPKSYDPSAVERDLYRWWEESGFFRAEIDWEKEPFVISLPPPNVTGSLHIGHAMYTVEDIMIRYQRMRGKVVLWLPGTDHAGIATQLQVERKLMAEGTTRFVVGRERFEELVWEWKEHHGGYITQQLRRLGFSCDWSRERFTLDEGLSAAVREAFVRLADKGWIYRGSYLVNWSPNLQTAVSDLEVEHSTEEGHLYFFHYPIKGSEERLTVATTRPETILGDTAVAVHPEDERYQHLIGQTALVPILGREIPIIADEYVDREFGTGALKITPGHDPNDYEIGQRHELPIINIMNKDATLNENAGPYAGLSREAAREQFWADLEAAGLTEKKVSHTHPVPRSQRGGEVVEPLISTQWFVRMEEMAAAGLEAVNDGRIRIVPERFTKIYTHWLENIRDWTISRQLWWGHRIPVWYVNGSESDWVAARSEEEAWERARAKFGEEITLQQEEDVLDTWFSSGLWPFSTLGWPDDTEDLRYFYPTSVMETGYDIIFFWVARMIMMGLELTDEVPFHTVYLHGLVRAADGRKMSKTLDNVVDPLVAADEYGTDALRYMLVTGSTPGTDMNFSEERITAARNFANKLWNTARFTLGNLAPGERYEPDALLERFDELPLAERWILSRVHQLTDEVTRHLEGYNFGEAGRALYNFIWGEFADWYVEAAKTRLYGEDNSAQQQARLTLLYVLERALRLLHPTMPFITETIWQSLPLAKETETIMLAPWPQPGLVDEAAIEQWAALQALVRAIRNTRQEYHVEPGRRIAATIVSERLAETLAESRDALASLARIDDSQLEVRSALDAPPEDAAQVVVADGLEAYLPLAGMVDLDKERERLEKQIADAENEVQRLEARLANKGFTENAPAHIVEGAREQLAAAQERLARLQERHGVLA